MTDAVFANQPPVLSAPRTALYKIKWASPLYPKKPVSSYIRGYETGIPPKGQNYCSIE